MQEYDYKEIRDKVNPSISLSSVAEIIRKAYVKLKSETVKLLILEFIDRSDLKIKS